MLNSNNLHIRRTQVTSPVESTGLLVESAIANKKVNSKGIPQGRGAPRTKALVEGLNTDVILDTGCTSNIVSISLLRKLKITSLEDSGEISMVFADGKARSPVGLVRNLSVKLNKWISDVIDAYVNETNGQYDFILGRDGMHQLSVGVDMSKHFWYANTNAAGVIHL